ncbi:MAG: hypothetical protein R3191_04910 [Anaerolineales bacterium]|nr:hypothetical protein [Anaerolineales bacterium]
MSVIVGVGVSVGVGVIVGVEVDVGVGVEVGVGLWVAVGVGVAVGGERNGMGPEQAPRISTSAEGPSMDTVRFIADLDLPILPLTSALPSVWKFDHNGEDREEPVALLYHRPPK